MNGEGGKIMAKKSDILYGLPLRYVGSGSWYIEKVLFDRRCMFPALHLI